MIKARLQWNALNQSIIILKVTAVHSSFYEDLYFPGLEFPSLCVRTQWPQRSTSVYFLSFVFMERRTKKGLLWNILQQHTAHHSSWGLGGKTQQCHLAEVTSAWSIWTSPKAAAKGKACIKINHHKYVYIYIYMYITNIILHP